MVDHADEKDENSSLMNIFWRLVGDKKKPASPRSPSPNSSVENRGTENASGDTILYLAYGSNLAASTFLGRRGISPLSSTNVLVPGYSLVFDLPGIPYWEPCFANIRASPTSLTPLSTLSPKEAVDKALQELSERAIQTQDAHDAHDEPAKWTSGLIGVVYEVTREDFAKIIKTEGGGESYADVEVTAYTLPTNPPASTTPDTDAASESTPLLSTPQSSEPTMHTTRVVTAHTLLAPLSKTRPNSIAQPSPRYLGLLTTGAAEHALPEPYIAYLQSLHPYRKTTLRQKIGATLFVAQWAPIVFLIFALASKFSDPETGRAPKWIARARESSFGVMWWCYGVFYERIWGNGERTEGDKTVGEKPQKGVRSLTEEWQRDRGKAVDQTDMEDAVVELERDLGL